MPRKLTDEEKAGAAGVGARMRQLARLWPGGISAFRLRLVREGAPGVSSPRDIYAKFNGRSRPSSKLIKIAADLLLVQVRWLETGKGQMAIPEPPGLAEARRDQAARLFASELADELEKTEQVSSAVTRVLAKAITDRMDIPALKAKDRWDWGMVPKIAELARLAPHLRSDAPHFARITELLVQSFADQAELLRLVTTRERTARRVTHTSSEILWLMLLDAVAADRPDLSSKKGKKRTNK